MSQTVRIDTEMYRIAKFEAVRRGQTLQAMLSEIIKEGLVK